MSKPSNPTLIGGFVLGAVALLVAAVMLFGGAELFTPKTQAVSYFPGKVRGLRVGANVEFQGVRVGYVNGIQLLGDVDTLDMLVKVRMEILPDQMELTRAGVVLTEDDVDRVTLSEQDLVEAGMRARLKTESFVTGQLLVQLELLPNLDAVYRGPANGKDWEIPTVPSNVEQVLTAIQKFAGEFQDKIDIDKLLEDIQDIGAGLNQLVNSQDIRESLAGANRIINDKDTQELTGNLRGAVQDLQRTLVDTRRLINDTDGRLGPLIEELMPVINQLDDTLAAGGEALSNASAQIKGDTEMAYQLGATMEELTATARSLRVFLDYIERNPEAFLRGKRE